MLEKNKITEEEMLEDRFVASDIGLTVEKPYFQQNEDWYYYDENKKTFLLTEKAPQEAYASYEQWIKEFNDVYKENNGDDEQTEAMSLFGLQGGEKNGM